MAFQVSPEIYGLVKWPLRVCDVLAEGGSLVWTGIRWAEFPKARNLSDAVMGKSSGTPGHLTQDVAFVDLHGFGDGSPNSRLAANLFQELNHGISHLNETHGSCLVHFNLKVVVGPVALIAQMNHVSSDLDGVRVA
jgi:hypothetical protein